MPPKLPPPPKTHLPLTKANSHHLPAGLTLRTTWFSSYWLPSYLEDEDNSGFSSPSQGADMDRNKMEDFNRWWDCHLQCLTILAEAPLTGQRPVNFPPWQFQLLACCSLLPISPSHHPHIPIPARLLGCPIKKAALDGGFIAPISVFVRKTWQN